ncbi:MAG: hypothetical protein EPN26_15790 [Rhodospirillales bacterium]|nr:MAG: hypothetical protein EPN26_15790 [Rhodospirillales bacterium]
MATLSKLKLVTAQRRAADETPEQRMRSRMIEHLTEQREMALAMVEGRVFKATRTVREKDATGNMVMVQKDKRLRPIWWATLEGRFMLELRYANAVLTLGKDSNAIEVGGRDKLVGVIETVIEAVNAGELDAAMNAALASRKKPSKTA